MQGEGANHLGIGGSMPATCFPTAVTVSNTWEPELGEKIGVALAEESASMNNNVVLGPGLCIKRDPLCGRNFEYISEDPYLAGKMAAGYVRGIQNKGLSACPKHFACNQQETRRQASDSVLDERTLREIYLTGFEIVVKESDPKTIMTSYNLVNGTYANENEHILKEILFGEWGFNGAVVTDWGGSNDHAAGVKAGSAFEMPAPGYNSARELVDAVNSGKLSIADVDARVEEALKLIITTDAAKKLYPKSFDIDAHHELAREIAAKGIVLLKNDEVDGTPRAAARQGHQGRPHRRLRRDPALPGRRLLARQLHQGRHPARGRPGRRRPSSSSATSAASSATASPTPPWPTPPSTSPARPTSSSCAWASPRSTSPRAPSACA